MTGECYFAGRGGCDGRLTRHHVIPKQRLKREFPRGAMERADGTFVAVPRELDHLPERLSLADLLADESNLIVCCFRHHELVEKGRLDVAREGLPERCWEFARMLGLGWFLEQGYSAGQERAASKALYPSEARAVRAA